MKALNKSLNTAEKLILLLMFAILIVMVYYYFVDQPVKKGIKAAEATISECEVINPALAAQIQNLEEMKIKLEEIKNTDGSLSCIESYNNVNAETEFIHEILADTLAFSMSYSGVTREEDLIRRAVSITFQARSYEQARDVIEALAACKYRCLVSNVNFSKNRGDNIRDGYVSVTCLATFYETMVGGMEDLGLPTEEE